MGDYSESHYSYQTVTTEASLPTSPVNMTTPCHTESINVDVRVWRATMYGIGGSCICCIGVVCNFISILVLANFKNKSSAPVLLICLAVSDSLYLLSMMFLETIPIFTNEYIGPGYRHNLMPFFCVLYPVPLISQCLSIYLVVTITLERYTVVARPFHAHKICNLRNALITVVCLTVLVLIYHVPIYLAFECNHGWYNRTQSNITKFERTDFGQGRFYNEVYYKWINPAVTFVLPFLTLLCFNSMMLRALWRDRNATSGAQNRMRHERRLGKMVLVMTSVFFLFELMAAVSFILVTRADRYTQISRHSVRFTAISDLGLLINSAINFLIYCGTGKKFRDIFRHLARTFFSRLHLCATCQKRRRASLASRSVSTATRSSASFDMSGVSLRCFRRFKTGTSQSMESRKTSTSVISKSSRVSSYSNDSDKVHVTIH
ncbi:FMRFamide receptor [Aplysia californica]|uniref:FMRFamide receptor n=1 Tax=Aplysia californica TaxID=6500 RepID=A0ABM1VRH0_APLCA|nr:FMRFamide receptor [Aplysia californica]